MTDRPVETVDTVPATEQRVVQQPATVVEQVPSRRTVVQDDPVWKRLCREPDDSNHCLGGGRAGSAGSAGRRALVAPRLRGLVLGLFPATQARTAKRGA